MAREVTIAIRDDGGVLRRVTKIVEMKDGIAVAVPYHSANEGWLFKHPMHYDRTEGAVPISEMTHYTAEDKVKLSIHLGGFVHFSRAGKKPILSGFDDVEGKPKGIGVQSPDPINVTSGPLFGVLIRKVEEYHELGERKALVFEPEDLWHHPRDCSSTATAYNLEGFMFPRNRLIEARNVDGKKILRTQLPFISLIEFRHDLRVVEFQYLPIFIGLIIHRITAAATGGFCLAGPGCGPPGAQTGISAWYPKPSFTEDPSFMEDAKSLDYRPNEQGLG